jgi:phage terminase large subunit
LGKAFDDDPALPRSGSVHRQYAGQGAMSIDGIDREKLRRWRHRPQAFVREVFGITPDCWQDDVLEAFPYHQRIALKSCKGSGKTALLAWLAWNFLLTRWEPKIAAASISVEDLSDGLWAEMAKWQACSPMLEQAFEWTKTRIFARERPETWFMEAHGGSKSADVTQLQSALAGLRADYVMLILDEAGGIPDPVMVAADVALCTGVEGHILLAGNPTHLEGPLYNACAKDRRLWYVVEVTADPDDPRRSTRVKPEWAREQIAKYGSNDPWVLANVLGRFPPRSLKTLIGPDEVSEAVGRHHRPDEFAGAARVLGVDVARFGDDASVIFPRQGLTAFLPQKLRNVSSPQGAGAVERKWADWSADAVFIDDTSGGGSAWIDSLRDLGRSPTGVRIGGLPSDPRFADKRTEMYFEAVEWIRCGGALPDVPELVAALTQTTYTFQGDKLLLEHKESVKHRLGYSPDDADAFALTFAQPVMPRRGKHAELTMRGFADLRRDVFRRSETTAVWPLWGSPFNAWRR